MLLRRHGMFPYGKPIFFMHGVAVAADGSEVVTLSGEGTRDVASTYVRTKAPTFACGFLVGIKATH